MSHFHTLVLLPADTPEDEIESAVESRLYKYREYDGSADFPRELLEFTVKYRSGELAAAATAVAGEEFIQSRSELRDKYQRRIDAGEYAELLEDWDGGEIHPDTGDFGRWENPNAKWDWWAIGGRWDGALEGKRTRSSDCPAPGFNNHRNIARVSDLPEDFSCFAIVTPDGSWNERGRMGWWASVTDENADWPEQMKQILAAHQDCIAVTVDCHI